MKKKVKDGFAPAEDLFLQVVNAYLVAAFMHWSGMTGVQSPPVNVRPPPDVRSSQQDKILYLNDVIGSFVDRFCLTLPDVKNAIEKQRQQRQEACPVGQSNDNVAAQSSISSGIICLLD